MKRPSPPHTATPACSRPSTSGAVAADAGALDHHVAALAARPDHRLRWRAPRGPSSVGADGMSSTRTGSRPMDRSRRMLACPSTPSPQTPTAASASADQEIGWRIALRNAMGAAWLQQGGGVRWASSGPARRRAAPGAASPARSARRAASSEAARHSSVSPTHSNGFTPVPRPSSARKRSSLAGFCSGSSPAKTASSAARSMNGARTRSMKQHLSQRPHQWSSRCAGLLVKGSVAAAKGAVVSGQTRRTRCATQSSLRGRR